MSTVDPRLIVSITPSSLTSRLSSSSPSEPGGVGQITVSTVAGVSSYQV